MTTASPAPPPAFSATSPRLTESRAWTLVGAVAFVFATVYAIAVIIFRLPTHWFGNEQAFRIALALHVELAVFFWLMSTMAALWAAARDAQRSGSHTVRGLPSLPTLALIGTIAIAASPLAGGVPIMADYFPWLRGNPLFASGFGAFCVAVLLSALQTLRHHMAHRAAATGSAASALPVLAAGAAGVSTALFGGASLGDLSWAVGHTLLFAHGAALCLELPGLTGASNKIPNRAARLLAACSCLLPLIPVLAAPGTPAFHTAYTESMRWLLWPPLIIAAWACLPSSRRSPNPVPAYALLAYGISCVLLLCGLLLGSAISSATTLVTAHYHAAVGAIVIARMASTYLAAQTIARGSSVPRLAQRQLVTYAIGLTLLSTGLAIASLDHAPRKTSAAETVHKGQAYRFGMIISGVGGLFAMTGSLWLVINLGRRPAGAAPESDFGTPVRATAPN